MSFFSTFGEACFDPPRRSHCHWKGNPLYLHKGFFVRDQTTSATDPFRRLSGRQTWFESANLSARSASYAALVLDFWRRASNQARLRNLHSEKSEDRCVANAPDEKRNKTRRKKKMNAWVSHLLSVALLHDLEEPRRKISIVCRDFYVSNCMAIIDNMGTN